MILSLIGSIVHFLVNAYILVLFIRMILDWVAVLAPLWRPRGLVASHVKRQLRRNTVISVSPRLAHAKYGISVTSVG